MGALPDRPEFKHDTVEQFNRRTSVKLNSPVRAHNTFSERFSMRPAITNYHGRTGWPDPHNAISDANFAVDDGAADVVGMKFSGTAWRSLLVAGRIRPGRLGSAGPTYTLADRSARQARETFP